MVERLSFGTDRPGRERGVPVYCRYSSSRQAHPAAAGAAELGSAHLPPQEQHPRDRSGDTADAQLAGGTRAGPGLLLEQADAISG